MSSNKQTYFIDSTLIIERSAEIPNADFVGGMNAGASCAPGMGINTGDYDPKESDWPRPVSEVIKNSSVIGGVPSGIFAIDDTFGTNALLSLVQTGGTPVAPDAIITQVQGFDLINRTGKTVPANTWLWGVADNPSGFQLLTPEESGGDEEVLVDVEEAAVAYVEYVQSQSAMSAAQALVSALSPGAVQDDFNTRLASVYIYPHFNPVTPASYALTRGSGQYISRYGNRFRNPGIATDDYSPTMLCDTTISAGSGWSCIYINNQFETKSHKNFISVGDEADIITNADQGGGNASSVRMGSHVYYNGGYIDQTGSEGVFVAVNYEAQPRVIVIREDYGQVIFDQVLPTTVDMSLTINNDSDPSNEREACFVLNLGADLTNVPMPATDVEAIITAHDTAPTGFAYGWGSNNSRPAATPSVLSIVESAPVGVNIGDTLAFTATCIDGDSVDRTGDIIWRNKYINWNNAESYAEGGSYSFTPEAAGRVEIEVEYEDQYGIRYTDEVIFDVAYVESHSGVTQWDISASHPNIDGYSNAPTTTSATPPSQYVRFGNNGTSTVPFKGAAITNHSNYGRMVYAEITYVTDSASGFGFGLTSSLNGNVAWSGTISGSTRQDGAGSFSVVGPSATGDYFPITWMNGTSTLGRGDTTTVNNGDNGFASGGGVLGIVYDGRDTTTAPTIYLFNKLSDGTTDNLAASFKLWNCRTDVLLMAYKNVESDETTAMDIGVNGGGNGTFEIDPRPIFDALTVDRVGMIYGWTDSEAQA